MRGSGRFGGRQIVAASWIEQMKRPSPANPNFGLHLWLGDPYVEERRYSVASSNTVRSGEPFASAGVFFIDGFGGQRVYVVPAQQLTIVRIGETRMDWDDTALVNIILAEVAGMAD